MRNMTGTADPTSRSLPLHRQYRLRHLPALILCVVTICFTAMAAPSNLDPAFGAGGKVISSPDGSEHVRGTSMALQSDGKIVMAGSRDSSPFGFTVARYNADGSLDTGFGNMGWSTVSFGAANGETASSITIQSDGKIVVGGTAVYSNFSADFAIARFTSSGNLDTTFDGDGKVTISFNDLFTANYEEFLDVLKIGSDGKILAAGMALNSGVDDRFIFARINTDGSPDPGFGNAGRYADVVNGSTNQDYIFDLVILPDGKFVIAGRFLFFSGSFRVAIKYSAGGGREWTYSQGQVTGSPNDNEALNGIAMQPDGKFVIVGKRLRKIFAIRLNADGTPDNTFVDAAGMPDGQALSAALQPDGKIVANLSTAGAPSFSLIRYNTNGSLDTAFGNGGIASTTVANSSDNARKLLIEPDGKILVGGASQLTSPTRLYFSMVRYLGGAAEVVNPLFDYDNDGKADISVFRPTENQWYVLKSTDLSVSQLVFALAGDIPMPADYDGDGKTDYAIFRPASGDWWYLSSISNNQNFVHWGQSGDIPRPSDFDGDGKTDFVVFRPSDNFWYRISSVGVSSNIAFGLNGNKPVRGDFDGDGRSDPAIFRPSTGDWWYRSSINGAQLAVHWGLSTDIPVPADYDGDRKTDLAVYRPSTGAWYVLNSLDGSFTIMNFGISEDKPVPADYDGDRKADVAVFRPSTGVWYRQQTTAGFSAAQFGVSTDAPTESSFTP